MRRTLFPALALIVGVATACATTSTGKPATPSTSATTTTTAPSLTPTATTNPTVTPPSPPARGPRAVVKAYYDAINAHDYRTAWNLGGKHFSPTYSNFVAAFAGTAHDRLWVLSVSGPAVTVSLEALQTSGAIKLRARPDGPSTERR